MQVAVILFYFTLQLALYGHCQLSGPPITPATLSLSTVEPTASFTLVHQSNSSTTPTPTGSAQFPTLSGYSSCVTNCLALGVAAANCTSLVAVNCFCVQLNFTQELYSCVNSSCSSELGSAESLAQQFCDIASVSPSLTFPSNTSPSSTSSQSSTTSVPTSTEPVQTSTTTTPSSAALGKFHGPFSGISASSTLWGCLVAALLTAVGPVAVV